MHNKGTNCVMDYVCDKQVAGGNRYFLLAIMNLNNRKEIKLLMVYVLYIYGSRLFFPTK